MNIFIEVLAVLGVIFVSSILLDYIEFKKRRMEKELKKEKIKKETIKEMIKETIKEIIVRGWMRAIIVFGLFYIIGFIVFLFSLAFK